MKKIIATIILASFLVIPVVGLAQKTFLEECTITHDITKYKGATGDPCPAKGTSTDPICCLLDLIAKAGDWIFAVVMIIAAVFISIGAFLFITAAGSPEKLQTARNYLIYALIGVVVAFLAKGLITLVQTLVSA